MASLTPYMEKWRSYFGSSGSSIFEVLEAAFAVASSDCPGELLHHKKSISQMLQVGCNRPKEMNKLVYTNIHSRFMHATAANKSEKIVHDGEEEDHGKMEMNEPPAAAAVLPRRTIKIKIRKCPKPNTHPSKQATPAVPLIKPSDDEMSIQIPKPNIHPSKPATHEVPAPDAVPLIKASDDEVCMGEKLQIVKRKMHDSYKQAEELRKKKRPKLLDLRNLPKQQPQIHNASKPNSHRSKLPTHEVPAPAAIPLIKPSDDETSMRAKLETAKRKLPDGHAEDLKKGRRVKQPRLNCARLRAEAEAAAEAKPTRDFERETARQAPLLKIKKSTVVPSSRDETSPDHSQDGMGGFRLRPGVNPLEQLGLFLKVDDEDEEDAEPNSISVTDVEEGEIV